MLCNEPLPLGERRAVVITGTARGGTSFVASICHHLGIPLGRGGPRYEDKRLRRAFMDGDTDALTARAQARMNESPTWAWKLPAITFDPTRVERALESPHFIVVFKDPLSIALRKSRVGTAPDPLSAMHGVLRRYETILDFAQTTTAPCLLMSFDKAVRDVPAAAAVIAQFCGIVDVPPDIETLVRRDQTAYLAGHQPQTVD